MQVDAHSNLGNLLKAQGLTHHVSLLSWVFVIGNAFLFALFYLAVFATWWILGSCDGILILWTVNFGCSLLDSFLPWINARLINRHICAIWRQYGFNLPLQLHGQISQDYSWRQENSRKPWLTIRYVPWQQAVLPAKNSFLIFVTAVLMLAMDPIMGVTLSSRNLYV